MLNCRLLISDIFSVYLMPVTTENELALMAADPDIQRELREINEEFASMEADGLDPA